jgi:hypothetical protein
MTIVLFAGDLLVMAFMIGVVVWVSLCTSDEQIDAIARLPLEDDGADAHRPSNHPTSNPETSPHG